MGGRGGGQHPADAARVRGLSPTDVNDGVPGATEAAPSASLSKARSRTPTPADALGGPVGLMGREQAAAGPMGRGVWTTLPAWKTRGVAGEPAGTRSASSVGTGARGKAPGGGPLFDARVGVPGLQVRPPGEAAVARAMMGHERAEMAAELAVAEASAAPGGVSPLPWARFAKDGRMPGRSVCEMRIPSIRRCPSKEIDFDAF